MDSTKYDYYVGGRWRNRDNVLDLVRRIREKGYAVYCFFEAPHSVGRTENDPEEDMAAFELRNWRDDPYVREVFENDMAGIRASERFVMLLPAGKSCHIEAGAAYGMGKECTLIGEVPEAESLYLVFGQSFSTAKAFVGSLAENENPKRHERFVE